MSWVGPDVVTRVLTVLALLFGGGATVLATWAGSAGLGADDSWYRGVNLRVGGAHGPHHDHVGGGISGGK
jgi:hypothetical protein